MEVENNIEHYQPEEEPNDSQIMASIENEKKQKRKNSSDYESEAPEDDQFIEPIVINYPSTVFDSTKIDYLTDYVNVIPRDKYDPHTLAWVFENYKFNKNLRVDYDFLKRKMEKKTKKYYKYHNFLEEMTYRLEKHGSLAPLYEIARKIPKEKLEEMEESDSSENENLEGEKKAEKNNKKNSEYINYYDQNSSFIDDGDDYAGEENDGFFRLNLKPGSYTVEEIIKNLHRRRSLKTSQSAKKKKSKKLIGEKSKKKLGKKRKNDNNINNKSENNDNKTCMSEEEMNTRINDYIEKFGGKLPINNAEKEQFIRRNIRSIIDGNGKDNKFLYLIGNKLSIPNNIVKILYEYELFKTNIENNFSNMSKFYNKFLIYLNSIGVKEVQNYENFSKILSEDSEANVLMQKLIEKISTIATIYSEFFGKNLCVLDKLHHVIRTFIPNVEEKNKDYIYKINHKINETFEKEGVVHVKLSPEIFLNYIKDKNIKFNLNFRDDALCIDCFFLKELGERFVEKYITNCKNYEDSKNIEKGSDKNIIEENNECIPIIEGNINLSTNNKEKNNNVKTENNDAFAKAVNEIANIIEEKKIEETNIDSKKNVENLEVICLSNDGSDNQDLKENNNNK